MPTDQDKTIRKLRAILSADVKGYSLLMANYEAYTIKKLEAYRDSMSGLILSHSGRVVDAVGDNLLAEFSSVVDAVQCSVEIQRDLQQKNANLPTDKRLEFRIGVNIGDVVQEGDRIYGNGVNVAARIEGLADPGGVCVSRNAYDHVKNKLTLGYEYIGEHSVKNIKDPVRVYKLLMDPEDAGKLIGDVPKKVARNWIWATAILAAVIIVAVSIQVYRDFAKPEYEPTRIEEMAYPLPDKPSIAVLAFDNMTGDKTQEYFSDGLSEEIITALASVPELFVIARNSSFTYKGKPVKVQQISEELGVRYVLEGSVRKSGDNIRITVQLIDALKGHHLWAENFDRNIEDLFTLQEEIAVNVITELRVKLRDNGKGVRIAEPCSKNLKAYLAYLKAVDNLRKFTVEGNLEARRFIEKAIALDSLYSCAYSFLGSTYRLEVYLGAAESPMKSFAAARKWYEKAIDVNPSNPGGQAGLADILSEMGFYEQAIEQAEKALTIDSNFVMSNQAMGFALYRSGRSKEAIPFYEKALRFDPYSTITLRQLGQAYFLSGQHEQAIQTCNILIDRRPQYLPGHLILASAYSAAGHAEEAKAAASTILKMNPKFTLEAYSKRLRFKNPADKELIISNLHKAGLPEYPPGKETPKKPSIAVLPFDNLSDDPEQEYFIDGIAEDIITALSKTDQLVVIARNSSFTYKGKPVKIKQVAEELGVRYVLEGSVRKTQDRVRITAQLIDATTEHHLWAERYDREMKDIFALQDEITMKIVGSLQITLTSGEQGRMLERQYKTLEGQMKFSELLSAWNEGTKEGRIRHGQLSQELIELEPDSPAGYSSLGWYYYNLAKLGISPRESIGKAYKLAQKAISLDDSNPFSYALLNAVYLLMRKYEEAIAAGERSIELDPNGAFSHLILGETLGYAGMLDEAFYHIKKAIRLQPHPQWWYYYHLGRTYWLKGQYENALREFRKTLHLVPDVWYIHVHLAITYAALDRQEEAEAAAIKAMEMNPNISVSLISKSSRFKNQEPTQYIIDAMRKAGFPE